MTDFPQGPGADGHPDDGVDLTVWQLQALTGLFRSGCNVVAGRVPGHVHAVGPGPNERGVLLSRTACVGIDRTAYFALASAVEAFKGD